MALTRLHIASCLLSFILKSLQSLIALRELTINCVNLYFSNDPILYPLLTEVVYCLSALCSPTKLCLRGAWSRSTAQCGNDLVVIGWALRAWPLSLLNPVYMELPVLSLRTPQNKSDDVGNCYCFRLQVILERIGAAHPGGNLGWWDNVPVFWYFWHGDIFASRSVFRWSK